jgi:DNA-binding transcriptional regulator LsrR (DeoR family)
MGVPPWETVPHKVSEDPPDAGDAGTASLLAAAELYYQDHLSQQQIADRLGISRSTVSRMLQLARAQGIVRIEIQRPLVASDLAAQLESALGLRRVVVVPTPPRGGLQPLVAPAVGEIERLGLRPGDAMAISWGATMWEIAQSRRFPSLRGVCLVPAIAGLDEIDVRFQTNEIARRIADASGADVRFIHSPALPSAELRRSLLADPEVGRRLGLWDRLKAALVGIGPPPGAGETGPGHVIAGRVDLSDAVGDVVSRYFDIEGTPTPFDSEERLLGVSPAQLRNTDTVIAVAAGAAKAGSIVGAARAGLIDVLVTDAATAAAALEQLKAP